MKDLTKAILSLYPNAIWELNGDEYSGLVWKSNDIPKPTEEELITECDRLDNEHLKNEYKFKRAVEYPPIGDQLDALFHAGVFPTEMAEKIQAIKNKYPKGTTE